MRKRITKIISAVLASALIMSTMSGCLQEDTSTWEYDPQLMEDKYEVNTVINNQMRYTIDYVTERNNISDDSFDVVTSLMQGDSLNHEFLYLFDHLQTQVDNWEIVTVGKTKMGELAKIVDAANEKYVTEKTNAIIEERKAEIKAEYDKAKAKAEARGKEYTKPMKEPIIDDINIENPYEYYIQMADGTYVEYEATRLIDPSLNNVIYFHVEKYHVPYVTFELQSCDLYNVVITQESDWIMNGVYAADVLSFIDNNPDIPKGDGFQYPEFVDDDGLNKAAKKNIVFSGNIRANGEGFTWESLKILCNALRIEMSDNKQMNFTESSDGQFTYYMMQFALNPFEDDYLKDPEGNIYVPMCRLLATFDSLSQRCINWATDTYSAYEVYPTTFEHELQEPELVNVHEYKVDTTNYQGMRDSIKQWVAEHAEQTTTKYCMIDENGEVFGELNTAMNNVYLEPIINNEPYTCLEDPKASKNSTHGAVYISQKDLAEAEAKDSEKDKESFINKKKVLLVPSCAIINAEGEIIGNMNESNIKMKYGESTYFVADYNYKDGRYSDVKVLAEDQLDAWLMLYIKTYQLDQKQTNKLKQVFKKQGCVAVRDEVNEMFREAELAQSEQNKENHNKVVDQENSTSDNTVDFGNTTDKIKDEQGNVVGGLTGTGIEVAQEYDVLGRYAQQVKAQNDKKLGMGINMELSEKSVKPGERDESVQTEQCIQRDIQIYKNYMHVETITTLGENDSRLESGQSEKETKQNQYFNDGILYTNVNDEEKWTSRSITNEDVLYRTIVKAFKDPVFSKQANTSASSDNTEIIVSENLGFFLAHNNILGDILTSNLNFMNEEISWDQMLQNQTIELRYNTKDELTSVVIKNLNIDMIKVLTDIAHEYEVEDTEESNARYEEMMAELENGQANKKNIDATFTFYDVNSIKKSSVTVPDDVKESAVEENTNLGFDQSELDDILGDETKEDKPNKKNESGNKTTVNKVKMAAEDSEAGKFAKSVRDNSEKQKNAKITHSTTLISEYKMQGFPKASLTVKADNIFDVADKDFKVFETVTMEGETEGEKKQDPMTATNESYFKDGKFYSLNAETKEWETGDSVSIPMYETVSNILKMMKDFNLSENAKIQHDEKNKKYVVTDDLAAWGFKLQDLMRTDNQRYTEDACQISYSSGKIVFEFTDEYQLKSIEVKNFKKDTIEEYKQLAKIAKTEKEKETYETMAEMYETSTLETAMSMKIDYEHVLEKIDLPKEMKIAK